ncbi:DUF1592 domain-containing protein [Sphingobium sp. DC-2]|uniref:DUF1592 domain-containing protein n=1 Tax=Sphingobium sp. DC-2 TaxID=1303256 RepID=UPI0004C38408|nr:DUF1592 domain-containing protein [Sphingobium sp. DC-2]
MSAPVKNWSRPVRAALIAFSCLATVGATGPSSTSGGADPSLRLISVSQYRNILQSVFGADVLSKVRFAPVKRTDGLLAVGSSAAVVTPGVLDPLDSAARAVAERVVDPLHRDTLIPCKPASASSADEACAQRFLSRVGLMLYRRPMTQQELTGKVMLAGRAAARSKDFYSGLATALSSMLVSPNFLFIRENAEPDPARPGQWRLDGYSKASRLSFFLWDSAPDAELLAAAARGDLHTPEGLKRQVERMTASPLLTRGARAFFTDFLALEAYDNVAKDPVIYPAFTQKVAQDAREQILRTIEDHLITRGEDYRDLFTTRRIMLSAPLAGIYGTPLLAGPSEWKSFDLPADSPRAGLLTQIGFLAQYAHPGRSSPTRRGKGIREVLLCQHVPDPPPNVDFSIVEDPNAHFSTARQRLVAHNTDPTCRGCHMMTDPIGLGLEKFDGAGQFRATEKGAVIDTNGNLDGAAFTDAIGLGRALRDNPTLKSCISNRLYAFGVGRPLTEQESEVVEQFPAVLDKSGYRFKDMLRLVIFSPSFFAIKPQKGPAMALLTEQNHAH